MFNLSLWIILFLSLKVMCAPPGLVSVLFVILSLILVSFRFLFIIEIGKKKNEFASGLNDL